MDAPRSQKAVSNKVTFYGYTMGYLLIIISSGFSYHFIRELSVVQNQNVVMFLTFFAAIIHLSLGIIGVYGPRIVVSVRGIKVRHWSGFCYRVAAANLRGVSTVRYLTHRENTLETDTVTLLYFNTVWGYIRLSSLFIDNVPALYDIRRFHFGTLSEKDAARIQLRQWTYWATPFFCAGLFFSWLAYESWRTEPAGIHPAHIPFTLVCFVIAVTMVFSKWRRWQRLG